MKQRITRKDLENLTEEQKRRLNELWIPSLYDVAVAKVLKNVVTDEYDEYEYVIGGISIHGTSIYLTDISAGKGKLESQLGTTDNETGTEEDPEPGTKIDPVFGERYLGFGGREDFNLASKGIEQAFEDEQEEDNSEEGVEKDEEEMQKEDFQEEDLEDNYELPVIHIKGECTPPPFYRQYD